MSVIKDHVLIDTSQVLLEDAELAQSLRGERLTTATRECVARAIHVPAGPWSPRHDIDGMHFGIGLLMLDGLLVRRVGVAGRFGAELLGDGDLLRPWQQDDDSTTLAAHRQMEGAAPQPYGGPRHRVRDPRHPVSRRSCRRCSAGLCAARATSP